MKAKQTKGKRYLERANRLSQDFLAYLKENPLVALGLTLVAGTMAVTMSGKRR